MIRSSATQLRRLGVGLLLSALAACSSDSPTAPRQTPPPGGGGGAQPPTTWRITVNAVPDQLAVGSASASTINIEVVRADNGAAPPDGTSVVVTTTLGELIERGSGVREGVVRLTGGRGAIALFPGNTAGIATVTVQLEQSAGQDTVQIGALVVQAISPNQGPPEGGITASITGQSFAEPVTVQFRVGGFSSPAEVLSVDFNRIVVRVPAVPDGAVFGNDGRATADVIVTSGGTSSTLTSGFTYVSGFFVSSVSPSSGSPRGGDEVTISGQGFEAPVRVEFLVGGRPFAAEVVSVTPTAVRVRLPTVDLGLATSAEVDVRVTNRFGLAGQQTDTIEGGFLFALDPDQIFLLSHVTPSSGREGARVTIHGTAFEAPAQVLFDGVSAQVVSVSATQIVVNVPQFDLGPGEERLLDVQVTLEPNTARTRTATLTDAFTVIADSSDTFFIESVAPSSGDPAGGDTVDIFGSGFESPVRVTFGGSPAQVVSVSSDRIRVLSPRRTVPAGSTQTVDVAVTINYNEAGSATDSLPGAFTYAYSSVEPPVILSISPASGPNEGGTRIRIRGSNFTTPLQVIFGIGLSPSNINGVEATVESVTPTELVVITPAATGFGQNMQNQLVDIMVRHLNSGLVTVAAGQFQYGVLVRITSISLSEGSPAGGDDVIIFGQGFDSPVAVEMGGVAQQVISVSGTEILVRTVGVDIRSCADRGGATQVVNIESGAGASGPVFTYRVPRPLITGIAPASGPQAGNTQVVISGVGFSDPVQVRFGDQTATVVSTSPTSITARTPLFAFTFDTEVCDDTPTDGQAGERSVPTAVDVTVENLLTTCEGDATNAFVVNPTDTSCRDDNAPVEPEPTQCTDGFDNDTDGFIDEADPQCTSPTDDNEAA